MIFLSGQIGNIPKTLDLAPGGLEGQSRQVMENIKLSLETNGFSLKHLTKCTVMLEDISQWSTFNNIYKSYFETGKFPARTSLGVDGLALGALVEVECIGMR
jgi:reactive intermediate/imine deaminase